MSERQVTLKGDTAFDLSGSVLSVGDKAPEVTLKDGFVSTLIYWAKRPA
ncbi:MAG: hypothetical protein R2851_11615 [Caldilineaceae bacterium]